jgi:hypothetical protein
MCQSRRGIALVTVLMFVTLVLTVAALIGGRVRFNLQSGTRQEQILRASYAAKAGLQRSLEKLSQSPTWQPARPFSETLSPGVSFSVEVANNYAGTTTLPASGDRPAVPAQRVWLKSTGYIDGQPLSGGFGQAEALGARPDPIFAHALHCTGSLLQLNAPGASARIDAFTPAAGYQPPPAYAPSVSASVRAEMGIDARNAVVDGNAILPSNEATFQADTGSFTGVKQIDSTLQIPWVFRKPRQFAGQPLLDQWSYYGVGSSGTGLGPNGGSLPPGPYQQIFTDSSTPSGDLTLLPGVYYVRGNFEIGVDAKVLLHPSVTAANPCIFYVGSQLIFEANSQINMTPPAGAAAPDPRRLQFYTTDEMGDQARVILDPDSKAACTIAGRRAYCEIGTNAELYGAIVCSSVVMRNPSQLKLHYSRDLAGNKLQGQPEWVLVSQGRQ